MTIGKLACCIIVVIVIAAAAAAILGLVWREVGTEHAIRRVVILEEAITRNRD
jgi:hypothetical protein